MPKDRKGIVPIYESARKHNCDSLEKESHAAVIMSCTWAPIFTSTYRKYSGDTDSKTPSVEEHRASDAIVEKQLVSAARDGDEAAFEQLVRRYDRVVFRLALQLTGSEQDAHDIYQEAFIRVYRNLTRSQFDSPMHTWIYRVVVNLCIDAWRKKQICKERPADATSRTGESYSMIDTAVDRHVSSNPERELLRHELRARINDALKTLTPRERVVFHLRHHHGLRVRAVGEILNTTDEAVKNVLYRTTRKLRVLLADIPLTD